MGQVTLTVRLTESEVAILDDYARSVGLASRSDAVRHLILRLGDLELQSVYADAWNEWESSGDATLWDAMSADGLQPVPDPSSEPARTTR